MTTSAAAQFIGDIPRYYDRRLGPIIFQDYAAELARRAAAAKPNDVLEIAAGTGISTVALRQALPASAHIVATDLNPPMLEMARAKLPSTVNVDFQQADAMALPFPDSAFDLVAIQFGVMFFPDKPAAYAEARRVLKPGGTFVFNTWSTLEANPYADATHAAGVRFLPDNPPKFYLTPFGYADPARVRADLAQGGFAKAAHETVRINKLVPDWRHLAEGAIYGNPMLGELLAGGVDPEDVIAVIAGDLANRFGPAPARLPLEAIFYQTHKA